jgi:hypothetical protein
MLNSPSSIAIVFLSSLLLMACQEKKSASGEIPPNDSVVVAPSPQPTHTQVDANLDQAWNQAMASFNTDSLVDASNLLSTDSILFLLNQIKSDSIVFDSAFGGEGCSGDSSKFLRYRDGAKWTLREGSRSFVEVQGKALERLGLHSPYSIAEWTTRFGKAAKTQGPLHYYPSNQPDATQLEYFQHRWKIMIYAPGNQIQKITFEENFDDC